MSKKISEKFTQLSSVLKTSEICNAFMGEIRRLAEAEVQSALAEKDCERAMAVIYALGDAQIELLDNIKPSLSELEVYMSASTQILQLQMKISSDIRPHWPNHDYFKRKDKALKKLKNLGQNGPKRK